jgi:hypothetical protein
MKQGSKRVEEYKSENSKIVVECAKFTEFHKDFVN